MIISFKKLQSIKSKRFSKICAHFSTDQVSAPSIKMTCFENLYISNLIALNSSLVSGNVSTKSRMKVKKGIGDNSIS